ncbi:MAG: 5-oxoprolinase subunit PxpB [Syntrophobacteraceae bacterium]
MGCSYASPRILPCGETAVSVELGSGIDRSVNSRVHALRQAIKALELPGILDLTPTYRSLLIQYDPWDCSFEQLLIVVEGCLEGLVSAKPEQPETVEIPVCYGGVYGPDLDDVAAIHGCTVSLVVALHSAPAYHVYMIGFAPGFPYLGGLDERLYTPRLNEPRQKVPAGSVGIADRQTGIYPLESPGGWRLIGRTPLKLFDLDRTTPFLISPGSTVRFVPITREAFEGYQNP